MSAYGSSGYGGQGGGGLQRGGGGDGADEGETHLAGLEASTTGHQESENDGSTGCNCYCNRPLPDKHTRLSEHQVRELHARGITHFTTFGTPEPISEDDDESNVVLACDCACHGCDDGSSAEDQSFVEVNSSPESREVAEDEDAEDEDAADEDAEELTRKMDEKIKRERAIAEHRRKKEELDKLRASNVEAENGTQMKRERDVEGAKATQGGFTRDAKRSRVSIDLTEEPMLPNTTLKRRQ